MTLTDARPDPQLSAEHDQDPDEPVTVARLADVAVAPGVRLLRAGLPPTHGGPTEGEADGTLLVRRADQVTRLGGEGTEAFVVALLAAAREGVIPLGALHGSQEQEQAVRALVDQLAEAGLLLDPATSEAVQRASPTARALWLRSGREGSPADIATRLRTARVEVVGSHPLADRLAAALADAGLQTSRERGAVEHRDEDRVPPDYAVVVGTGEDDPLLVGWNRWAFERRLPWWAVLPHDGRRATVGPFVLPGASACWRCFTIRRAANFPDRTLVDELAVARSVSPDSLAAATPGVETVQVGVLLEQIVDRVGLGALAGVAVPGAVTTVELGGDGLGLTSHRVLRVPRCEVCSPASGRGLPQVWYHGRAEQ